MDAVKGMGVPSDSEGGPSLCLSLRTPSSQELMGCLCLLHSSHSYFPQREQRPVVSQAPLFLFQNVACKLIYIFSEEITVSKSRQSDRGIRRNRRHMDVHADKHTHCPFFNEDLYKV